MNIVSRAALSAGLLILAGCASMSDRYHVSGRDGGGDYYYAPPSQSGYYDPYGWSGFDFYYGFGWGSPFGPFGYGAWWNAWPYVSPPHPDFVVIPGQEPQVADRTRHREPRPPEAREPRFPAPADAAPERRERRFQPVIAPQAPARRQRGDSPIP